jgi:integrase/recombinase XerD
MFFSTVGAPILSRVMVFYIIKDLAQKSRYPEKYQSAHPSAIPLPPTCGRRRRPQAVQDMLGHESITTTEIYTHLDTEYLKETIYLYHPRMKF